MPWSVEIPFEFWRVVVVQLRTSAQDYDQDAAAWIEQTLDQTAADRYDFAPTAALSPVPGSYPSPPGGR